MRKLFRFIAKRASPWFTTKDARREQAEAALRESESRLRLITDNVPAMIAQVDRDCRFTFVNRRHAEMLGRAPADIIGRHMAEIIGEAAFAQVRQHFESVLSGNTLTYRREASLPGGNRHLEVSIVPDRRENGEIYGCYALVTDITERLRSEEALRRALEEARQAHLQVQEMARQDTLTGLNNRRSFQSELDRWVAYARRHQRPLAILFLDLNRFKWVNDTYGHGAGDQVLVTVARLLKDSSRNTDILGRWGGDEFVAMLPETNAESATLVAMRIIEQLQRATVFVAEQRIPLSASIGIAAFPEHGADARTLLDHADAAMYRSKQQENSGIAIFSDTPPAAT